MTPVYRDTDATDAVIRRAYDEWRGKRDRKALARAATILRWPKHRVLKRGRYLGLAKVEDHRDWTDAEDAILEQNAWRCLEVIARKLQAAGFHRTTTAIHLRRKRTKALQTGEGVDWFCARGLADACGVDSVKVINWIKSGALKAQMRGLPTQDKWLITRADLRKFIVANPYAVNLARVEAGWFVDLVARG